MATFDPTFSNTLSLRAVIPLEIIYASIRDVNRGHSTSDLKTSHPNDLSVTKVRTHIGRKTTVSLKEFELVYTAQDD